tara:strand:- start:908 stop:2527 length:1620 start_codon:yes stop_codon:yes gene_type:complete
MKTTLPTPPFPYDKLTTNITFGEFQSLTLDESADFVDKMRNELLEIWDSGISPYVGISEEKIIERFKKLHSIDLSDFYIKDDLYKDYEGFIRNFTKMANGINQFFPNILKTRINGMSMYDFLSNENLFRDFRYTIIQKVRFDKMYSYSKYLCNSDWWSYDVKVKSHPIAEDGIFYDEDVELESNLKYLKVSNKFRSEYHHYRSFQQLLDGNPNIGFWIEDYEFNQKNEELGRTRFSSSFVKDLILVDDTVIKPSNYIDNRIGFNRNGDEKYYAIRYFNKDTRLFPNIFQVLRLGLNQVAINFPTLTARWIYEKYLGELEPQPKYKVYDSSAGWGGRLLGSLTTNFPLRYIGLDVNKSNVGSYESLGNFYNHHIKDERSYTNDFEIHYQGSEVIHQNPLFMENHKNDIDLAFTSPPYFDRERYSEDEEQSCIKFPKYKNWLFGFLKPTLETTYELLKNDRYYLINISDIKNSETSFYPLEQDTISLAINCGFKFVGKYGMVMTRSVGTNVIEMRNTWLDIKSQKHYKVEPIIILHKDNNN